MRSRDFELLVTVGIVVTVLVVALVLAVGFLSAVHRALRRVSPENRRMRPDQVWWNLIPVFNLVWCTVTVERVAESLRDEFLSRQLGRPSDDYGRRDGLTLLGLLASGVLFYPVIISYPIALVYAVRYWRQMGRYAERLKAGGFAPPPVDEGW